MPLPRVIARLNARYTNRFIEPVVATFPGYVRVITTGRHTGRTYHTPLYAFPAGDKLLIALTYGPGADWVQNVVASNALVEQRGTTQQVDSAAIVDRSVAASYLPLVARTVLRLLGVRDFMMLAVSGATETGSPTGT